MLAALTQGEKTPKELAETSGLKLNLTCYYLERLCAFGLVDRVGTRQRAGRPSPLYRAPTTAFFVPAAVASRTLGEELSRELRAAIDRGDGTRSGELYFAGGDGKMHARKVADNADCDPSCGSELWARLKLRPEEARSFLREMREILDRYNARPSSGGRSYLLHAAVAPVSGDTA